MLSLLVAHIVITVACFWSGCLFYFFTNKKNEIPQSSFCLITGLIFLTLTAQWLVLFFPLTGHIKISLGILLFVSVIFLWKKFCQAVGRLYKEVNDLSFLSKLLLILLWLIILMINAGPTLMDDTDSYHIQMVKWIQEYGTVPGLANLHERFGFNSSWFSSIALFSFSPATAGGFTVLNGVVSLWFCFYLLSACSRQIKQGSHPAALSCVAFLAFSVLLWPLIRGNAATANYDFITTIVVVLLFMDRFLAREPQPIPGVEWLLWPVYLFTVRIINFPVLLLSLFSLFFLLRKKNIGEYIFPIFCGMLLMIAFLARNILLSGYPFYPATYFSFYPADWKADPALMEQLVHFIKYYGRVSTAYQNISQTAALDFPAWIPVWFRHLFTYDKMILLTGLCGFLVSLSGMVKKKSEWNYSLRFFLMMSVGWLACWFFISPDPRFVYGCLLTGVFLFFYYLFSFLKIRQLSGILTGFIFLLFMAAAAIYLLQKPIRQPEYRNWVKAASLPRPPVKEVALGSITLKIPETIPPNWNPRCYASPLPCVYKINPRLKARGKTIRQGFRIEK